MYYGEQKTLQAIEKCRGYLRLSGNLRTNFSYLTYEGNDIYLKELFDMFKDLQNKITIPKFVEGGSALQQPIMYYASRAFLSDGSAVKLVGGHMTTGTPDATELRQYRELKKLDAKQIIYLDLVLDSIKKRVVAEKSSRRESRTGSYWGRNPYKRNK